MKPYWQQNGNKIYQGHVLEELSGMASESVHMVVTSPPYWGLRDYGLPPTIWDSEPPDVCEGGRDHVWGDESIIPCGNAPSDKSTLTTNSGKGPLPGNKYESSQKQHSSQGQFCQICGAWRGCLGLEPTPELFIKHMVEIFREVRRVLRSDGTLWLNLGSSYAGSGINDGTKNPGLSKAAQRGEPTKRPTSSVGFYGNSPNQSLDVSHVPAYGNDDKERLGLMGNDRAYFDSYDEPQGDSQNHRGCNSHNDQPNQQFSLHCGKKGRDNEHLDQVAVGSWLYGVQESTTFSLIRCARGVSDHEDGALVCSESETCFDDAPEFFHKEQNISGKSLQAEISDCHKRDMELFYRAYKEPSVSISSYYNTRHPNVKYKPKDLVNIPHLVAEALRQDGWWLRSDIIWHKTNPMPESVTDRPTKAHENMFLLTKSSRYYYDAEAIKEKSSDNPCGWKINSPTLETYNVLDRNDGGVPIGNRFPNYRNKRTVWTIPTKPFSGAHFAVFPPALIEPCILAGCPKGGMVLDPFFGSGTTAIVAYKHNRKFIGIELSEKYLDDIAIPRIEQETQQRGLWN